MDPSGEFFYTLAVLIAAPFTGGASLSYLPIAIGADIGMWQGGTSLFFLKIKNDFLTVEYVGFIYFYNDLLQK